jgi:hypothetical protein
MGETAMAGNGGLWLFAVFFKMSGIMPLAGRGVHSMTYPMMVNRDGAAAPPERLAPGIAAHVIAVLSLVCWVSVIFAEMAVWSAFN